MGNTKFSRFYLGLRDIEKTKTRDAKLAKDTGGSSKSKQKNVTKVSIFYFVISIDSINWFLFQLKARDNFIGNANSDLKLGKLSPDDFLSRMTSDYDGFCKRIDECCVAQLDSFEVDECQPTEPASTQSSHLCQFCEDNEAIVALSCSCQLLCATCFKSYAMTYTGDDQRGLTPSGNPIIDAENPMKCPHCTLMVTNYIITRR